MGRAFSKVGRGKTLKATGQINPCYPTSDYPNLVMLSTSEIPLSKTDYLNVSDVQYNHNCEFLFSVCVEGHQALM